MFYRRAANVQDCLGVLRLLRNACRLLPFIECIFADGGYSERKMAPTTWRTRGWRLRIVKRSGSIGQPLVIG
jgi:hypothetical protein